MNPQELCDGRGYAQYENGVLIGGTACSRETFCCRFFTFQSYNSDGLPFTDEEQFTRTCGGGYNGGYGDNYITGVTGVICHGTENNPNCDGPRSCLSLDAVVVKGGSCRGWNACSYAYLGSITDKSCYGTGACETYMWQVQPGATRFDITKESCRGSEACRWAKISTHISDRSCVGSNKVCYFIEATSVSDGSCRGKGTCLHRKFGMISGSSCVGDHSCGVTWPGTDSNLRIVERITEASCVGDFSCTLANVSSIMNKSCIGFQACGPNLDTTETGLHSYIDIMPEELENHTAKINGIVDKESCVGINACTGIRIDGNILEFSCRGDRSCAYAARNISIIEECQGVEACGSIPIVLKPPETEPPTLEYYNPPQDEKFSLGAIIGIVVASLVFLIGTTMFYFVRRERRRSEEAMMAIDSFGRNEIEHHEESQLSPTVPAIPIAVKVGSVYVEGTEEGVVQHANIVESRFNQGDSHPSPSAPPLLE